MQEELDRLLRTREVAALQGISVRWLYEEVKAGKFPPADFYAERRGGPNFWRESTVRRAREERTARAQQARQAASAPRP